ncbi:hypothetical protein Mal52_61430 [Symmachiella dynata]|uniref:TIGR04255 family protein n=1 Tax=Symmachiella dynata TaxID=2527995 RepID=A0A517ZYS8_9PLAN|nr:TIGR04255 family protein [Symmachiella dynata]QDU47608.1 hypothetical protein Mal52_61430 [Symmachiella dynata]
MSQEPSPSFGNPPVVETVLSIQFDELEKFRTTHFGLFHSTTMDRYPDAVDKQRLDGITEAFPLTPRIRKLQITPHEGTPERVWFRDHSGCEMIQLQPDRLAFNWCRRNDAPEYPRYEPNRTKLLEEFENFNEFATAQELGAIRPNLCEVIYVNHIHPQDNEDVMDCFASVFAGVNWISTDGWLPQPPEIVTFNRVFMIPPKKGRLYIEANIASGKNTKQFILLKITARVTHNDGDQLIESLDLAHEWVVKSFVSVTDEEVRHNRWGQE